MNYIDIAGRKIGPDYPPLVVAEIGINHEGSMEKAVRMIDDAARQGCECVKFQCHIIDDEMSVEARSAIPGNASESIWEIMRRCSLTEAEERELKRHAEELGLIYLCTPFSRAAAERLNNFGVVAYKIGSGECNNYPLLEHIASFGKPVIMSTGMNDLKSIDRAVKIFVRRHVPFALLHCTSIYPTPYALTRLNAITELRRAFPGVPIGYSDHCIGLYACFGATTLGASILEKHFTSSRDWPGPDIAISMTPEELGRLLEGSRALFAARRGGKSILPQEQPTINFACASVVSLRPIRTGETLTRDNIWVKRPAGGIPAAEFEAMLGRTAAADIPGGTQLKRKDIV
ncbi:MAG: N-acetylneuraminate synthase family protein [Victivallales bacterium]|nr:N-acetylneuraminate synthase family protein [Victivallales bacterium]